MRISLLICTALLATTLVACSKHKEEGAAMAPQSPSAPAQGHDEHAPNPNPNEGSSGE